MKSVAAAIKQNQFTGEFQHMGKIKTREGSPQLRQLYSTARTTASQSHSGLKSTTFLVNFVPIENVDPSPMQVRTHFSAEEIQGLAESIKEHGVLQPILVVQDGDRYQVIAGERRLRAAKLAGLDRIPARVLASADRQAQEINLRENLDRVDLHPIEEGEGYLTLLEAQYYTSHDSIAKVFNKPKSRVTECISFTRLPEATKEELLRLGLKSRALLRKLLNSPPEEHLSLVATATKLEESGEFQKENAASAANPATTTEELAAASNAAQALATATQAPTMTKPKREAKPFLWKCEKRSVAVPGFKWKVGEGYEKLETYLTTLKTIVSDVEKRLQNK